MAKFLTTLLSSGLVKEGLEKGAQGTASAAIGVVESFASKGLRRITGRTLSGVGLINPLLGITAEPIASELKSQLENSVIKPLFGRQAVAVNAVEPTSGSEESAAARVVGEIGARIGGYLPRLSGLSSEPVGPKFQKGTFAVSRDKETGSVLKEAAKDTPARMKATLSTKVSPVVIHQGTNPLQDTKGMDKKFKSFGPVAKTTKDFTPLQTVVSQEEPKFPGSKRPEGQSVMGTSPKPEEYTADAFELEAAVKLDQPNATSPYIKHPSLQPKISTEWQLKQKFRATSIVRNVLRANDTDTADKEPAETANVVTNKTKLSSRPSDKMEGDRKFPVAQKTFFNARGITGELGRKRYVKEDFDGKLVEEFIQQHRFLVADVTGDGKSVFEYEDGKQPNTLAAGFAYCTSPEMNIDVETIKEGTWEFERSVPTGASVGTIELSKGIVSLETGFWLWIQSFLRGRMTRRKLEIFTYGRSKRGNPGFTSIEQIRANVLGAWRLYNCMPTRYKAGQDWDASNGAIQIAQLEISYEWFEEIPRTPTLVTNVRSQ
jgi:phage tail-like protein